MTSCSTPSMPWGTADPNAFSAARTAYACRTRTLHQQQRTARLVDAPQGARRCPWRPRTDQRSSLRLQVRGRPRRARRWYVRWSASRSLDSICISGWHGCGFGRRSTFASTTCVGTSTWFACATVATLSDTKPVAIGSACAQRTCSYHRWSRPLRTSLSNSSVIVPPQDRSFADVWARWYLSFLTEVHAMLAAPALKSSALSTLEGCLAFQPVALQRPRA